MDPIAIIGYISLAVGSALALFSRIPKQTITNYEQLSVAQEKRIAALEEQSKVDHKNHLENIKAIADLQGQIKVYKELPLQSLADSMKEIANTQRIILTVLQSPKVEEVVETKVVKKI